VTVPYDRPPAGGASARSPVDPTGDDPGLDRRLRAADPLADALPDDASTALVHRLAADVAAGALVPWSRRRQRRRATLTLLAAALLLCLAAGTPGIAHRLAAWTGIHGSGVGEEDTSEYLLTTAPDFQQALESLRPTHLPLPPGYEWRKADISTAFDLHEPTYVSATGIQGHLRWLCRLHLGGRMARRPARRRHRSRPHRHQGAGRGAIVAGRRCRQDRRRPAGTGPDRHGGRAR
jgi:hypothetical protein